MIKTSSQQPPFLLPPSSFSLPPPPPRRPSKKAREFPPPHHNHTPYPTTPTDLLPHSHTYKVSHSYIAFLINRPLHLTLLIWLVWHGSRSTTDPSYHFNHLSLVCGAGDTPCVSLSLSLPSLHTSSRPLHMLLLSHHALPPPSPPHTHRTHHACAPLLQD